MSVTRSARLLVRSLVLVCALTIGSVARADGHRKPVPEKDARSTARAALRKEFKAELKSKDADELGALARVFIERAGAAVDLPTRYVFLDEALDVAEDAKHVALALDAAGRLGAEFDVDQSALAFAAVNAMARGSKDPTLLSEAASACIDLTGDAMATDDPSTAGKAISAAKSLSKKAKMDGLEARAAELAKLVTSFKRLSKLVETSKAAIAAGPSAADYADAARISWFAFAEWESGAAFGATCDDPAIRKLAELERDKSGGGTASRIELGDGWWEAAESEKDALARARMLARAVQWYELALPDADEQTAAPLRERVDSITYMAWDRSVALTTDFSEFGPANLALATLRAFIKDEKIDTGKSGWRTKLPRFPDIEYAAGVDYFWRLETNQGEITIQFFPDTAPQHVTNFLYLTELGFFDGLTFHRVIPGFMAQGGDPTGSGSGGPGYFIDGEYDGDRKHDGPGILSMANTGAPKSDGSQFFITFRATSELDGKHTVFGEVVDGMKSVEKLEEQGTAGGRPKTKLVIERASVFMR